MSFDLARFTAEFALAIKIVDQRGPVAASARTGAPYQPGIGPHAETKTVAMVVGELRTNGDRYTNLALDVPYPAGSRQKCDVCYRNDDHWEWAIEVKMLRLMGDTGKLNDNMLTHILSPYPAHRSAFTDCQKLVDSRIAPHNAVLIFGYDYDQFSLEPAIRAFELLASDRVTLGLRNASQFDGLIHPVHTRGTVYAWTVGRK